MQKIEYIRTEADRNRVIEILKNVPLDPAHKVTISDSFKRSISAEQRGLYFVWMTHIGEALAGTKDEWHLKMKEKHLIPIFERDDEEYRNMIEAVRKVWKMGMKTEAGALKKKIVEYTSITDASVKQMSEYMTDIDHFAIDKQIQLPVPDLYQDVYKR